MDQLQKLNERTERMEEKIDSLLKTNQTVSVILSYIFWFLILPTVAYIVIHIVL